MLRLAAVGPQDVVYDLGSGDGRVVIAAARDYGARGVGIEIDAALVRESTENARRAGLAQRAVFRQDDVLTADLREASVVTIYLLPPLVRRLQDRLSATLRPGARIVAHEYPFPDWHPDRRIVVSKTFYLYVVPARVGGSWRLQTDAGGRSRTYDLGFEQRYQEIKGAARVTGGILPAFEARLSGDRVSFILVEDDTSYRYEGRVGEGRMEGTVRWGYGPHLNEAAWRATRVTGAERG
jgi:SAM-dependent methyltransferase